MSLFLSAAHGKLIYTEALSVVSSSNTMPDAVLQRYHLLLPLPPRPEDRRKSLEGILEGLHCGI